MFVCMYASYVCMHIIMQIELESTRVCTYPFPQLLLSQGLCRTHYLTANGAVGNLVLVLTRVTFMQGVLFRTDKFLAQIPNERELLQNVKKYFFFFAEIAMQHYKFQVRAAVVFLFWCLHHAYLDMLIDIKTASFVLAAISFFCRRRCCRSIDTALSWSLVCAFSVTSHLYLTHYYAHTVLNGSRNSGA